MGLTKGIPVEGGSGGGRGHSAMEHWMKTAEIKDAAREIRRRTNRDAIREGLSEILISTQQADDILAVTLSQTVCLKSL